MNAIKVPSHIRDAPLPEGYVWCDGSETQWPVLRYRGSIWAIAFPDKVYMYLDGYHFEFPAVENIDQAFNLINARILLGEGHETPSS